MEESYENETIYDIIDDYHFYHKNLTYTEADIENAKESFLTNELLFIIGLLVVSKFGSTLTKKNRNLKWLNESFFSVIVGLVGGYIIKSYNGGKYVNSITKGYLKVFIIFLLPPIIFESAYAIKIKEFYKNLGTILIYALLGTTISILFIGVGLYELGINDFFRGFPFKQSLAMGALISATDPVCILAAFKQYTTDPNFFLLVFGESILNDAVSMVFYDTIVDFEGGSSMMSNILNPTFDVFVVLVGSTLTGMLVGFIGSYILKKISEDNKRIERMEVGVLLTFPWFSYLLCDIMGLSSIVVIFFSGISFHLYSKPYLSEQSEEIVHSVYAEITEVAETVVFIFIGIAFFADHPYEDISFSLPLWLIIFCLIARALNIGICSYLANLARGPNSYIGPKKQFFLWFAGVRGAMAFALAIKSIFDFPGVGKMFLLLTLIMTVFTLVYSSFLLEDCLHKCDIIVKEDENIFDPQTNNFILKDKNTFERMKEAMYNFHEKNLLPLVQRHPESEENVKSTLLQDFNNQG